MLDKGKFLRIKNRGTCPRIYLKLLGASTKDDRMEDATQGGWFGSETKFAPIPALNLGISVAILSMDAEGQYCFQYASKPCTLPPKKADEAPRIVKQLYWLVTDKNGKSVETETSFTLNSCKNWKEPIGDDDHKAFRVLRGYLRNAVDEDAEGFGYDFVDMMEWPPEGETHVYLSASREIRSMLRKPERYFKYLKPSEPHDAVAYFDNGRIFPRSDPDRTRIFLMGTVAHCSKADHLATLYDYCIDLKTGHEGKALRAEDGTFTDLSLVYMEVKKMLSEWRDVDALADLILKIESDEAPFEASALGYLASEPVPAAAAWIAAWKQSQGSKHAVLSTNSYYDELARYSYGKKPVKLASPFLRALLKNCGVEEARDCVPRMDQDKDYRLALGLEDWERDRLETAISIMHAEFPDSEDFPVQVFEPLTDKMKQTAGFTMLNAKPPILLIQRACLKSWPMIIDTLVVHECRHGRTKVDDSDRKFVDRADRDLGEYIIPKYKLPREQEIELTKVPLPSALVTIAPSKKP